MLPFYYFCVFVPPASKNPINFNSGTKNRCEIFENAPYWLIFAFTHFRYITDYNNNDLRWLDGCLLPFILFIFNLNFYLTFIVFKYRQKKTKNWRNKMNCKIWTARWIWINFFLLKRSDKFQKDRHM